MKISIKRAYLESMLEKAATVSGSGTGSSLNSFLMEADGEWLKVIRTDKVLSVVAQTKLFEYLDPPNPSGSDNRILINAPKFMALVKNLGGDSEITLDNKDGLKISSGCYSGRWLLDNLENYPPIPSVSVEDMEEIVTKDFLKCIDRVKFAASFDSLTPAYKQIFFHKKECWASDENRFQKVATNFKPEFTLVLPVAVMDALKFIKMESSEKFLFKRDKHYYIFKIGTDICICRIPGVQIPSYVDTYIQKVGIKLSGSFKFEIPLLIGILRRVGITSMAGSCRVDLQLANGSPVTVIGNDGFGNKADEQLICTYSGASRQVGVHWSDLVNALLVIQDGSATLKVYENFIGLESKDSLGYLSLLAYE